MSLQSVKKRLGEKEEVKKIKLTGTLFWPSLFKPQLTPDGKPGKFSINLAPDSKSKEMLEDLGLELRNKDDGQGDFITARTLYKPPVFDSKGRAWNESTAVGNGSEGVIIAHTYETTNKATKKKQLGLGLDGVQIMNLVEYTKAETKSSVKSLLGIEGDDLGDSDNPFAD